MNTVDNSRIIEIFREDLGLTQQDFSEKLGVARNTISRWEIGRNVKDWDKVFRKISKVFPNFIQYINDFKLSVVGDEEEKSNKQNTKGSMYHVIYEDDTIKQYVVNGKQYQLNKKTRRTSVSVISDSGKETWVIIPMSGELT